MQEYKQLKDEIARIKGFIDIDKSSLPPDGGPHFNRLIFSKSPYLLQHADNPVDWYPWSEEAFAKARKENKPVLLSVGYSTCHWCHVMEEESFNDRQTADVINRCVVPIKVDREERPDIDGQYMKVAQMMTGRGGWPLNILMTPDRKPFYAATYIPKTARMGMPGINELLENILELWRGRREMIEQNCEKIMQELNKPGAAPSGRGTDPGLLDRAYTDIYRIFDPIFGGFGDAPKFPMPAYIYFLLRYRHRNGTVAAGQMVDKTLQAMRFGGIFDQVGFGFHRYAVDREWLVPHFEKMLYDQALIALAYIEAFQSSGKDYCKETALEIFQFVLREMAGPEGGFCSGLDADSEGEEGKFYVWTPEEITEAIGEEAARNFCEVFDISVQGNFEGSNIPNLNHPIEKYATAGQAAEDLRDLLEEARIKLLQHREARIRPFRDEKVLTGWNGLMIAALAKGSAIIDDGRFLAAAEQTAAFIKERLCDSSGRLYRSLHLGEASVPAFLEDYAFFAWGLTELYEATGKTSYLDDAVRFTREMIRLFRDDTHGGFFDAGSDAEEALVRMKSSHDDAIPSANAVAAMNLVRLGKITSDGALLREGARTVQAFMDMVERVPSAYPQMLNAFDLSLGPDVEITLACRERDGEWSAMHNQIKNRFIPNLILRFRDGADTESDFRLIDGKPTAYVCTAGACMPPVTNAAELGRVLDSGTRSEEQGTR